MCYFKKVIKYIIKVKSIFKSKRTCDRVLQLLQEQKQFSFRNKKWFSIFFMWIKSENKIEDLFIIFKNRLKKTEIDLNQKIRKFVVFKIYCSYFVKNLTKKII